MFQTKKKKIKLYLEAKPDANMRTSFDVLLSEYLSGQLYIHLEKMMLDKIRVHIDWLPDYKCIDIQSKFKNYFFEIQIEEDEFSVSYDTDEADDPIVYSLESSGQFYNTIRKILALLK